MTIKKIQVLALRFLMYEIHHLNMIIKIDKFFTYDFMQ